MPTLVKGEDGRELAEKLGDGDALNLASIVHANTGETVTLVPYKLNKDDEWVLDEDNAHFWPRPQAEAAPAPDEDLSGLTVAELKQAAKDRGIDVPAKAKKADLIALLGEG